MARQEGRQAQFLGCHLQADEGCPLHLAIFIKPISQNPPGEALQRLIRAKHLLPGKLVQ